MAKPVRILILGTGGMANNHADSFKAIEGVTVVGGIDTRAEQLASFADRHGIPNRFASIDEAIAWGQFDAVTNVTPDAAHYPTTLPFLAAGKHVLCEKPLAVNIDEAETLRAAVKSSGCTLQVGHMKRYDAGLQAAKAFIDGPMGQMVALKAWYCDNTHRYAMTDAVQPLMVTSKNARKPSENPKADLDRYYMLAHGSHLVDTARYFAGEIKAVDARLLNRAGIRCWFVDVEFSNGTLGHLDLTVAVRMDWHEGFQIYGAQGSILGKTYNPWYYKSSEVDIFHESDGSTHRVLGADGHFYRRQLEGFADTILNDTPQTGADIEDGIASVRAMVAIAQSVRSGQPVTLAEVSGAL